jgi:triphosphatase
LRRFLEEATPDLVPVFTTDFTRSLWQLTPHEGSRIEVALDRGTIVAGERRKTSVKSNSNSSREMPPTSSPPQSCPAGRPAVAPEGASKAERGYRLANDRQAGTGEGGQPCR